MMIFTFYSYKGGVGRTMALANIAELFYQAGLKVLMVDWDLEAPGLERFFQNVLDPDEILDKPGIIDMLLEYKRQMAQPRTILEDEEETLPFEDLEQYLVPIYPPATDKGELWLLPAGRRSEGHFSKYANAVLTFDWTDFYQNWEGERYFEWLRQQLNRMADVVLIDSRTGVTEMGGVCTYHLADTVVMFCAPNQQNLSGTYKMAQKFKASEVQNSRGGRPMEVLIIPARIERAESELLDVFQQEFLELFEEFAPFNIQQLWQLGIPYIPKYAYRETVAVRESERASAGDMIRAFEKLKQTIYYPTIPSWPATLPWNEPYYKLPKRDVEIERIVQHLIKKEAQWGVFISGLDGIGKTATAIEIGRRCMAARAFERVLGDSAKLDFLVDGRIAQADDKAVLDFEGFLDELGMQLDHPDLRVRPLDEKRHILLHLLSQASYLVIIDNLETARNAAQIVRALPQLLGRSRALITSREVISSTAVPLKLEGLSEADSLLFLREDAQACQCDDIINASDAILREVHQAVGGQPLALKLIVGQAANFGLDFALKTY